MPYIQGQRRSPSKMVGGAKSYLESNPIPPSVAQRAQTNLMHTRTQRPHRDLELCLSVSCGGTGQQWTAAGAGALDAVDLGMALALLEEVAINPTIEPPELNTGLAQTELCVYQDPEERSSDPTRD